MFKEFLESLEDPERPLLGPNCWFLEKAGIILPKNKYKKVAHIVAQQIMAVLVLSQYVELYMIRSDLDDVQTNMKTSMLSVVSVIKTNTFLYWQHHWIELIDYITEADKFERENCDDKRKRKILDSYTRYSRRVTYAYWVLVYFTLATLVFPPLIKYSTSPILRQQIENGTKQFPHVLSGWVPFNKNHYPGNLITFIWHTSACGYGAILMAVYDANVVVIMVFFAGKLELIRERSKQMLGTNDKGVTDEQAYIKIRQLHTAHILLTKYSRLFNSLFSPVMFCYVVMCSLMLCASMYQLNSASTASQLLLMLVFLIFGVSQLFIFCWHSNIVLEKSEHLLRGPFESEWWAATVSQKKAGLLLAGQFNNPCQFTAGPFANLTLYTFISIVKGAYSFYTLLRD